MEPEQEQPKFFMLDEGTEDFYDFPDNWDADDEEEAAPEEIDVDLRKIVILDSTTFHRNILKKQLEGAGFKIAAEGSAAAEVRGILTEGKIRFVAVDIDSTDGGGVKVIQLVRSFNDRLVLILTSARLGADQLKQIATDTGYFLAKPFQKPNVEAVMKSAYEAELSKKKAAAPKPAG
ncbi:hypothetical protein HY522_08505 [bacterium]|nr:hypothetical protein [bacterium]